MVSSDRAVLDELEAVLALNICLVAPEYSHPGTGTSSGVGSAIHSVAHGLVTSGHRVIVVTFLHNHANCYNDQGVQVHCLAPGQWHWYLHKLPGIGHSLSLPMRELENSRMGWRYVYALHRQIPFDVIEATETDGLYLSLHSGNRFPPLVTRLHGDEYTFLRHIPGATIPVAQRLTRRLQRIALRRSARLIAPSRSHAAEIAQEIRRPLNEITVIPHALNPIWQTWQQQEQNALREPIILFVGRLQTLKGIFDAIRCFALIRTQLPEMRLVVVGGYHPTIPPQVITNLIAHLNLSDSVHLIGHQTHEQLASWYARAQILIMPSYYETFGLVALEAMTFGAPVAAYRIGALPEVTQDGATGLLAASGDVAALANGIVMLLRDPVRWQSVSQVAQSHAATYTPAQNIEATLTVYRAVQTKSTQP